MNAITDFEDVVAATCDDIQHGHAHGAEQSYKDARDRLKVLEPITAAAVSVAAIARLRDGQDLDDPAAAQEFAMLLDIWGGLAVERASR